MKIGLLAIRDGRSCEDDSMRSLGANLPGAHWDMVQVADLDHELGFAGAIRAGWEQVRKNPDWDYVFHAECDFFYNRPIPLFHMAALLERKPRLAQVCLKRQPVNEIEVAAGGIVEVNPDSYTQYCEGGFVWTEHRVCFSTNPCLYSTRLVHSMEWPDTEQSEGIFTHKLLEDPITQFAFWGEKFGAPMVEHVGHREGIGY